MSDTGSPHAGQLSPDGRWQWDGSAWRPVSLPVYQGLPRWLNLRLGRQATWWTLTAAVAVGLLTDQAFQSGTFSVAAAAAITVAAIGLATAAGVARTEPRLMIAAATVFGLWLAVRASPWLLWPDLVASVVLLGFAASVSSAGSLLELGTAELSARATVALAHVSAGVAFIGRPILESRGRLARLAPIARGLLIAAPICALLSVLLASADPVFASFFNINLDLAQLLAHVSFVVVGSLAMAGLLRLASAEPVEKIEGPAWRLGATEALVVLALLDAIFAAFATAQVLAATGAAAETLKSAGVTYSEYARSGFFQLLWAGGITLVALILFSRITGLTKAEHKLAFMVLSETAIALTLIVVVVAFRRLSLYEAAYGFTMLRLYSHIFAGWMALLFLLLAAELLGAWRRRRWFVGATAISSLVVLLALNFVNPEALVVELNVDHAKATGNIDAGYLGQLSSDATPAVFRSLPALSPATQQQVTRVACGGAHSYEPSIWTFNWSDAQSAAARRAGCR